MWSLRSSEPCWRTRSISRSRGQLGAHFTPRAFVERLVLPTVMDPLRAEWDGVKAAAFERAEAGDRGGRGEAGSRVPRAAVQARVLDPACGTGNFLYVTMELMKRLEGEVLDLLVNLAPGEGDRFALARAASIRISSSGWRRTRARCRWLSWCYGSAICNGISDAR